MWPQNVATALDVTVETITVTKRLQTDKVQIEAKKLIHQEGQLEDKVDTVAALLLYEKAFLLWPVNGDHSNRNSVKTLTQFGLNDKAAH